MTQGCNIDRHIVHVSELLFNIDALGQAWHVQPGRTLDCVRAAIEDTPGQLAATLQVLDKIQALKMCVKVDAHCVSLAKNRVPF